ncbi:hypothetical protein BD410DRAFT_886497 [Rickenella mellea]|uniref:Uncharacterized protein n=1 Tax=Rickenella mellea TaxID=50990 RepID=A0A4Y7PP06_9AGAM|nr:hypothetical protein BD410DRAFT_886497 [Rickenella mellea]
MAFETADSIGLDIRFFTGALLVGLFVSTSIYGTNFTMAFQYYTGFPDDNIFYKISVAALLMADTSHFVCGIHMVYFYLVEHYGEPDQLLTIPLSLPILIFFTVFSGSISHIEQSAEANGDSPRELLELGVGPLTNARSIAGHYNRVYGSWYLYGCVIGQLLWNANAGVRHRRNLVGGRCTTVRDAFVSSAEEPVRFAEFKVLYHGILAVVFHTCFPSSSCKAASSLVYYVMLNFVNSLNSRHLLRRLRGDMDEGTLNKNRRPSIHHSTQTYVGWNDRLIDLPRSRRAWHFLRMAMSRLRSWNGLFRSKMMI